MTQTDYEKALAAIEAAIDAMPKAQNCAGIMQDALTHLYDARGDVKIALRRKQLSQAADQ